MHLTIVLLIVVSRALQFEKEAASLRPETLYSSLSLDLLFGLSFQHAFICRFNC